MSYKVVFNHPAIRRDIEGFLESIPPSDQNEIMEAILKLGHNPRPHGVIKIRPPVAIHHALAQFRIRQGRYRILYDIDDDRRVVSVIAVRRRREDTYK